MENEIKKYKITYGLILICLVVYLYTLLRYGLTMNSYEAWETGAFFPPSIILDHEYWRFFSANVIHFGIVHILLNTISLKNIGCFIEGIFNRKQYLFIIVVSAFFTTFLPFLMAVLFSIGLNSISGGISGVIFGLLGSLCVLAYKYKGVYYHVYRQLLPNILLMFFISVTVPSVSLYGHLGGFIGGLIATGIVVYFIEKKKNRPLYH